MLQGISREQTTSLSSFVAESSSHKNIMMPCVSGVVINDTGSTPNSSLFDAYLIFDFKEI